MSPNLVEPLANNTDDETISVLNLCAVIEPDVVMLPSTCSVENDAVSENCKNEPVSLSTTYEELSASIVCKSEPLAKELDSDC